MRVLAVTGGHSFDRTAFEQFLAALPCEITWIEHPQALEFYAADGPKDFDAVLHYDMPGTLPEPSPPPSEYVAAFENAVAAGVGFVVLHHALAAWPTWDRWSQFVGGKYLYTPGTARGQSVPDSGYRHAVPETLTLENPYHPISEGLPSTFDLVDETYLCQVFTDDVTPLITTNADMTDAVHFSTALAMAGRRDEREGWNHDEGSTLVGWTRSAGDARVAYLQPGDKAPTLADAHYRRLVANALRWAARRP